MRRWAFRLERVARVRTIQRDAAHGTWLRARAEQDGVELRLQQLRDAARADAVGIVPGATGDVADVRANAFRAGLRAQAVGHGRADLAAAEQGTTAAAAVLLGASRAVDALERLEARQHEAWRTEADREATKAADDLSGTRAAATALRRRPEEVGP